MADLAWRALPVTTQTVRQLAGGRTARLVWALSFLPVVFALIYLVRPEGVTPAEFLNGIFAQFVVPTLLPITVLIPATAAFGNELEDRTLLYLTLKPVSRLRIVLGKTLGVLLTTLPAVLLGLAATAAVAGVGGRWRGAPVGTETVAGLLPATLAAAAGGTVLIACVFLAASLFVPRALLAGIVYIFVWESLLGRLLPGIQAISIRHQVLSLYSRLSDVPLTEQPGAATVGGALAAIAVVSLVALGLATLRLRSLDLE